jgi:hypothetical protein
MGVGMSFFRTENFLTCICFASFFSSSAFAIMNGRNANRLNSAHSISIRFSLAAETASYSSTVLTTENCTAVIIARHLLLTAGHCLEGARSTMSVQATNGSSSRALRVLSWKAAPGYRPAIGGDQDGNHKLKTGSDIQRDIAYIITKEDLVEVFRLQSSQVPNLLSEGSQLKPWLERSQYAGIAYGFGDSSLFRSGAKKELNVKIEFDSSDESLITYSSEPGRGQCYGDSGGGLFIVREAGQPSILVGILSGISIPENGSCGRINYAAYANISPHLCWIQRSSGISLGKMGCP